MGLFGKSRDEKVMREAYVLLWNAAERLKQGRALRDNLEVITTKVPWIDRKEFERTADSLIKCGTAFVCMAAGVLGELPEFKDRPFLSVAVPLEKELAILELFYNSEANQIRNDVCDFDKRDDGVPSISKLLRDIVFE
jgi:hypothetical protein